jgi:hypothetical protein
VIKRRGKSGLLALNKTWPEAKKWIAERAGKTQKVETVVGVLRQFLVEPFVPHPDGTEYYININSVREVRSKLSNITFAVERSLAQESPHVKSFFHCDTFCLSTKLLTSFGKSMQWGFKRYQALAMRHPVRHVEGLAVLLYLGSSR